MEPLAVDVHEAARLTSLSARTIRRHIRLGRLRVVRVGRRLLVPMESLRALLGSVHDLFEAWFQFRHASFPARNWVTHHRLRSCATNQAPCEACMAVRGGRARGTCG